MSRTRLRQIENPANSETYDDTLTQSEAEDSGKNLQTDLNHIRTQLRKLNGTTNWYDEPEGLSVDMYSNQTETAVTALTSIDVGGVFDVADPFDLSVYLNGDLLAASTITGSTITTERDYQEVDNVGTPVSSGTARNIQINYDIVSGDILQFVWTV